MKGARDENTKIYGSSSLYVCPAFVHAGAKKQVVKQQDDNFPGERAAESRGH